MNLFPANRQKLIDTLMAYAEMLLNKEATAEQIENAKLAVDAAQADFSPKATDGEAIPAGTWDGQTEGATLAPEATAGTLPADDTANLAAPAVAGGDGTDDAPLAGADDLSGDGVPDVSANLAAGNGAPVEQSDGLADA